VHRNLSTNGKMKLGLQKVSYIYWSGFSSYCIDNREQLEKGIHF